MAVLEDCGQEIALGAEDVAAALDDGRQQLERSGPGVEGPPLRLCPLLADLPFVRRSVVNGTRAGVWSVGPVVCPTRAARLFCW